MHTGRKRLHLNPTFTLVLLFLAGLFCHVSTLAQTPMYSNSQIGKITLPAASAVSQNYSYDPERDLYYLAVEIDGYPITTPLVLTPKEYDALVLKESLKNYFKEKTETLSGKKKTFKNHRKIFYPSYISIMNSFKTFLEAMLSTSNPKGL